MNQELNGGQQDTQTHATESYLVQVGLLDDGDFSLLPPPSFSVLRSTAQEVPL